MELSSSEHPDSERAARVRRLFEQAVALPSAERSAFLDEACPDDPALRRQVEALLAVDETAAPLPPTLSRWDRLEALFDRARRQAPGERVAFLNEVCGDDASLRAEVESLLEHAEEASSYFEQMLPSALQGAAPSSGEPGELDRRLIGRRVSHYEVLDHLGEGGMGVVYKARDLHLDRLVALKFLPAHLSGEAAAQARFVHEAKAASALDHPNIATVYEIGQSEEGRLFIVMAYYEGETLKEKIARAPLPLDEALGYAVQIAKGLQAAHEAEIVHRDVKPANVIVTREGVAKIVDFGLAKVHDVTLTQTGTTLGTVAYMSPEQARGEAVDHRTDGWALGVVLYEMLTGERPFRGDYEQAVLYGVLNEEPVPLAEANPALPADLGRIVDKSLQKDPAQRYQETAELLADLKRLQRGDADGAAAEPSSPAWRVVPLHRAVRDLSRRVGARPLMALAALALALLLSLSWFTAERVPDARHLAVLPFPVIGEADDAEAFSAGLLESLTSRLSRLEQFQGSLWVVPASEIDGPMKPSEARERLGVTMVVTGSIQIEGELARLTLNLIDATTQRQIGSEQIDRRSAGTLGLQDEAALTLARMLHVELQPQDRQALTAGGTTEPRANEFYLRGQGYLRRHQSLPELETAINLFETALGEDSSFALAHAGLGEAYWRRYRLTEDVQHAETAIRHSQQALALDDRLAPVYVTLGIIHSGKGDYDAALEALQKALEIDPSNAEAYRRRGSVYRRQGRFEAAEGAYKKAIELKPEYWRGYSSLGTYYYLTGHYQDAITQYTHGLRLAPANQTLLANLGAAYWQTARAEDAVQTFERILRIDSSNASAKSNLATAYFYQGRFEDAARLYEEELALRPHDHAVQGFLADAYYWIPGRRHEARQAYRKAIAMTREHLALSGRDPDLLSSLAGYYALLGARDTARVFLEQVEATLQPEKAGVVTAFGVGAVYELLGERERALVWMDSALKRGYGWMQVQHSPWLEDLRRDPAFQKQIAAYR